MGAFIRLKAPVKNKRALLDVGAAGPWAGIFFAVPILLYGLATSEVLPLPTVGSYQLEGNSILYALMKFIVFGRMLPADGPGCSIKPGRLGRLGWFTGYQLKSYPPGTIRWWACRLCLVRQLGPAIILADYHWLRPFSYF